MAVASTACTADPPPPIEQSEPTTTPPPAPQRSTVVVAIDNVDTGFNPHLLADQSPVANAVAKLVLPSAFRPVPAADNPAVTEWILDETVLVSAEVTGQNPTTITYQLRNDAQWSDGAPIAAEDFRYLWQQMITQPGVVDPAGYRLIDDVESSGGGKTVTVTLREPYPAWRELFTVMLPAHLVKDTPGGFATGLSESIPLSGGRFHVESVDRGRGEVLLERNDRFWDTPAVPDEILMRRGGSDAQLVESMRTGDVQVAQTNGGSSLLTQLGAVPGLRTAVRLQPRTLELTLNTRTPELADPRVRRGVLGLLDPDLLALVAAGTESSVVPARAQVLAPSDPGYVPTMPPRLPREEALRSLGEAGYVPVAPPAPDLAAPDAPPADAIPDGTLVREGAPLALVLGVPEGSETARTVARTAADLLLGAGIDATVTELPSEELYGEAVTEGAVHAVVGWMRAGEDAPTAAVSRFACPPALLAAEDGSAPTSAPAAPRDAPTAENPAAPETTETTTSSEDVSDARDAALAQLEAPSNLSGACDPSLDPDLRAALTGAGDARAILMDAQPELWELAVNLPILQDRAVVAAGPDVDGVSLTGAVPAGIVADTHLWKRTTR
ncbi:ABC transporter family substrate-binding protein [Rhodococcus chondri]|uniref:ABC transporter family substrate-binding protein n=1 Tax=Rhodococcus chondri TaxID=3065941 RepID=A0ABU7JWY6_9NOCA|nr:ABC transporter family substrate-binding protein [Rhodococcus sp. CC-R104]